MRWAGLVVALLALGCPHAAPRVFPVQVAAASDLSAAFEAIGRAFEEGGGPPVRFSFGSSGLLARQLREGAPFDAFAAADRRFINEVIAAGACDAATRALSGRGRLALWTRKGMENPPRTLAALSEPRFTRIAIANPEHAPYGRAAREALQRVGAWDAAQPRLVLGENVRQALQFAQSGNVDAALVAYALVIEDTENPWVLVEDTLHAPLEQELVSCVRGANAAGGAAFTRFVSSPAGQGILRRFGFAPAGPPSETAR